MRWPNPRTVLGLSLIAGLCLLALPALAAFDNEGYEEVISTIRCDCGCHPQSVKDCACGRAAEMRSEIRAEIESGKTAEQLIAGFVEQHGEQARIAPTAQGFNLVAWIGPLLGLLGAGVALALVLRRWSGQPQAAPVQASGPTLDKDDPYAKRLQRELAEME